MNAFFQDIVLSLSNSLLVSIGRDALLDFVPTDQVESLQKEWWIYRDER